MKKGIKLQLKQKDIPIDIFALGPTPITTEDDDGGETGSAKHERGTRRGSLCVHAHRHDVARECIG